MMVVLASASPRRHELLNAAGIAHIVRPAEVPEVSRAGEQPTALVRRLAAEKALAVPLERGEVVLGADTLVVVDGVVFGKPEDRTDAERMLRSLSGRDHWVYTGICLRSEGKTIVDSAGTRVMFGELTEAEIEEYLEGGEWAGKAGGYAIQGRASRFVEAIEGSYHNVVGLPVSLVYSHLKRL
jgi:septum formation protein